MAKSEMSDTDRHPSFVLAPCDSDAFATPSYETRIVLACAEGMPTKTVARRLRVMPATVGKRRAPVIHQRT